LLFPTVSLYIVLTDLYICIQQGHWLVGVLTGGGRGEEGRRKEGEKEKERRASTK
jgi:hypothetical protein